MKKEEIQNNIKVEQRGKTTVVYLSKEIEAENIPAFRDEFAKQAQDEFTNIVVDLSAVTFLDSMGVGLFASLFKKSKKKNGNFVFAGADGQPRSVLGMVGFDELVTYYDSVDQALKNLNH